MPELPDISIYVEALEKRVRGTRLQGTPDCASLSCCGPSIPRWAH